MRAKTSSPHYWLMKTEPETFSFDDLLRDGKTSWDGVRNYQARNFLKECQKGDLVLIYHSVSDRETVGIAEVTEEAYPDIDPDRKGDWVKIDIKPIKKLNKPVSLKEVKEEKTLEDLLLIKQSRLSVIPVKKSHFLKILKMGETTL
jgi:predicted RNA-binding protein with PUA-like domain